MLRYPRRSRNRRRSSCLHGALLAGVILAAHAGTAGGVGFIAIAAGLPGVGAATAEMAQVRILDVEVCTDSASNPNRGDIVSDGIVQSRADAREGTPHVPAGPTAVPPDLPRMAAFSLPDRSPAPDVVNFRIDVPTATEVEVQVFDVAGRLVRDLVRGRVGAGSYGVTWDTCDASGSSASPGVYLVRARCGTFQATRKVVVVR